MDWFRDEFNTYEYCYYPLVHVKKLGYKACQVPTRRVYPKNEVPSKIKGFSSNLKLLKEIFNLAYSKTRPDQTRPDQTRPDQTRPDQTRPELIYVAITYIFIIIQNIKNYNLCCNLKSQHRFFVF